MNRVVNKTIKKTATPRTGRLIDAAAAKSVSVSEGAGGGLSHSHVNKALIDLINQGLSTESSVQFKDVEAAGYITAGALNGTPPDDLPAATDQLFGVVKIDGTTIKIDLETGAIYAQTSGTGGVSSWNELTDKPANLVAIAALSGAGLIKRNADGSFVLDTTVYQTYDADLATIAAIADGVGYLKRTGQNTWIIDTSTFLTTITKAMVEGVLTGNITTHTHSQYLTAITKAMVEAVLTGIITSHQHNYLPINGGNLTGLLTILNQKVWYEGNDGSGSGLDADTLDTYHETAFPRIISTSNNLNSIIRTGMYIVFDGAYNIPSGATALGAHVTHYNWDANSAVQMYYNWADDRVWTRRKIGSSAWNGWILLWNASNSNLKTVDWYAKILYAVGVYSDGPVVAGALNGTPPDDLPVATSSLFGVIKLGLSLHNNAGVVNINGRHYTTTSTYTDSAVREITAEIPIGTGNLLHTEAMSLQLPFLPSATSKGVTGNVLINPTTWAGSGLIVTFLNNGSNYVAFITNYSGSTISKDGIKLSVSAKQTI